MLTYEDCLAMCELTHDEVAAIAMHEHLPQLVAAELGNYLLHREGGVERIRQMIIDDIALAEKRHDVPTMARLKSTLKHFIAYH